MFKNISKKFLFISLIFVGFFGIFTNAQEFYYELKNDQGEIITDFDNESLEIGKIISEDAVKNDESILQRLLGVFRLKSSRRYNTDGEMKAFAYVKMIVNYMLGLVSFIALVLIIYGFYLMFFSEQEEGMQKAKKILSGVAIAMAIMGLSRFIISFIFWVYNINTGG